MPRSVEAQVIDIIARHAVLAPEMVTREMTIADLGLDSLGLVETIFAIEEMFDVTVPFNANDPASSSFDMTNVGTVVAGVEALIAAKP
jgi:acyl carrier protein